MNTLLLIIFSIILKNVTTTLLTDPTKSGGRPDSTGGPVLPDKTISGH